MNAAIVSFALFLDFDLEETSGDDEGLADLAAGMVYMSDPTGIHAGGVLLQDDVDPVPVANMTLVDNTTFVYPNAYVLDAENCQLYRVQGGVVRVRGHDLDRYVHARTGCATGDRVDDILFKASRARLTDAMERLDFDLPMEKGLTAPDTRTGIR